jgi:hypothetical protein
MTTASLIHEIEQLPLRDKLFVIERVLKSIRTEEENGLEQAVESLYNDYKTDKELIAFTQLDTDHFYEAR